MAMNERMIKMPHQAACGFYRVAVVDAATKEVVWQQKDWGRNLILNNGMDSVAVRTWAEQFTIASAGTGITPTSRTAGTATAAQAGTTVTLSGTGITFDAGDVGNMIKWGTTEEARIVTYTSPTQVEVTPSQSVSDGAFVIYHTNQTDLTTQVKRTSTYLTGAGNCGTTVDTGTGTVKLRRTFDFSAEVGTVNYTEVALNWHLVNPNTAFSRILLPSAVPVNAGQQLRLVYELQIVMSPTTPVVFSAAVSGWPVAPSTDTQAQQQIQYAGLNQVATNGTSGSSNLSNEPSDASYVFISPSSTALASFNSCVDRSTSAAQISSTLSAYVALSFSRDKTSTFPVGQANGTTWRSIGVGTSGIPPVYSSNNSGFVVLFDQNQTKANTQTLTFTFRNSWSRVLA